MRKREGERKMVVDEKERKGKRSIQSREKYIGIEKKSDVCIGQSPLLACCLSFLPNL